MLRKRTNKTFWIAFEPGANPTARSRSQRLPLRDRTWLTSHTGRAGRFNTRGSVKRHDSSYCRKGTGERNRPPVWAHFRARGVLSRKRLHSPEVGLFRRTGRALPSRDRGESARAEHRNSAHRPARHLWEGFSPGDEPVALQPGGTRVRIR